LERPGGEARWDGTGSECVVIGVDGTGGGGGDNVNMLVEDGE
jgi:hypothetical protein